MGPLLSVILPTFNRKELLKRVLNSLAQQSAAPGIFEVVVVDDGSTDGTGEDWRASSWPEHFHYHGKENAGAARARNFGAERASGQYLLFMDDDVIADQSLLAEHNKELAQGRCDGVVGNLIAQPVGGDPDFIRFAERWGLHSDFSGLASGQQVGFSHFNTANVSIKKSLFQAVAGFDENFTSYGWEDIDLGYRLEKSGTTLVYNAQAKGYHQVWWDLASFSSRMRKLGHSAVGFLKKHPELLFTASLLSSNPEGLFTYYSFATELKFDLLNNSVIDHCHELVKVLRDLPPMTGLDSEILNALIIRLTNECYAAILRREFLTGLLSHPEAREVLEAARRQAPEGPVVDKSSVINIYSSWNFRCLLGRIEELERELKKLNEKNRAELSWEFRLREAARALKNRIKQLGKRIGL